MLRVTPPQLHVGARPWDCQRVTPGVLYRYLSSDLLFYSTHLMSTWTRSHITRFLTFIEWLMFAGCLIAIGLYVAALARPTVSAGNLFFPIVVWQLTAFGVILLASQIYILWGVGKHHPRITRLLVLRALLVLAFGGLANRSLGYTILGAALLAESVAYWQLLVRSTREPPGRATRPLFR